MNAVVFLGPSVPLSIAREIVEADFRPPAQMGDVYTAAQGRPTAIAIIDGFFESRPAVWHKEILFALSQGIRVLGGASIFGGRGSFIGALLGAILLTEVVAAVPFLQIPASWNYWMPGILILVGAGIFSRARGGPAGRFATGASG